MFRTLGLQPQVHEDQQGCVGHTQRLTDTVVALLGACLSAALARGNRNDCLVVEYTVAVYDTDEMFYHRGNPTAIVSLAHCKTMHVQYEYYTIILNG